MLRSKPPRIFYDIPDRFLDDGCSSAPDSIIRTNIRPACRIHDWQYCTRAHGPDIMTAGHKRFADRELRANLGRDLPWYVRWARIVYYTAVRLFGDVSAYNSCGIEAGDYCRHNMPTPQWMKVRAQQEDN